MQEFYELICRKMAQLLYRVGIFSSSGTSSKLHSPEFTVNVGKFDLRYYPYHFIDPDKIKSDFIFNTEGFPIRYHLDRQDYINAVYPAYWGLIHANQYAQNLRPVEAKEVVLRMSDFLLEHGRSAGDKIYFDFTVDHPHLDLKAPWISGLTQALATSLFLRAYEMTSHAKYLQGAEQSARVLITTVKDGGVLDTTSDGYLWIEEYPGIPKTHVLNGCLFGAIALVEIRQFSVSEFQEATDRLLEGISIVLPQFSVRKYLLYDLLRKQLCNPHYMGLHALLLYHLYLLHPEPVFHSYFHSLGQHTNWPLYMKSIHHKLSSNDLQWLQSQLISHQNA